MKHLRKFNESYVLPKNMIDVIKDICIELEDLGFLVFTNQLGTPTSDRNFIPNMSIYKITRNHQNYFKYNEIEEVIERIKDYAKKEGYDTKVEVITRPVSNNILDVEYLPAKVVLKFI